MRCFIEKCPLKGLTSVSQKRSFFEREDNLSLLNQIRACEDTAHSLRRRAEIAACYACAYSGVPPHMMRHDLEDRKKMTKEEITQAAQAHNVAQAALRQEKHAGGFPKKKTRRPFVAFKPLLDCVVI